MKSTTPSPPNLEINLLGHAEIRLNGLSIQEKFQNKVLALLAYLATERRPHTREHLIGLFWPEVEPESARTNLRVALYRLRQSLGDERYLQKSREALFLAPDGCRVDVAEFMSPLTPEISREQLESRIALYRGPFFDGADFENCPDFMDWLTLKVETCRRQALALLDKLVAFYETSGDLGKALSHVGRRLELEPWDESSHRKTMALLAQDGQQGAALAHYEACRRILEKELGAVPAAQTTALFDRIKAGKLAPEVAKPSPFSFLGQNACAALNQPLNVLIVDDHLLFRAGLCLMLNELGPDVTVFEAASCEEALALPEPAHGFDIILLDLKFPGMSGLDGLLLFRNSYPAAPVVLFSGDEEMSVIQASRQRGARGYISKAMGAEAIVAAIERVLSGGVSFPFDVMES
ncbi:MAG: BTAD domain-containing putative transcriptional regulator [Sulfuricellaceae bacterium]